MRIVVCGTGPIFHLREAGPWNSWRGLVKPESPGVRHLGIIRLDAEMQELARYYLDRGIFSAVALNDALHAACAVVTRRDLLVSWNFRHLVNRRRRVMINNANVSRGYPTIEIVAPPEV